MKKLVVAASLAAALVVPSVPAQAASSIDDPVGIRRCGWGLNFIVYYYDLEGQYHEVLDTCK